ncbi:unnamed protein product [Rhizophagus irregularis]|nr:unnamed protein product [Rhizophagus irregularis]
MSPQYKDRNVLNYRDKNFLNYKNKNVLNYKDKISSIARTKLSSSYKDRNVLKYEDKSVLIVGQKSCPHSCEDKNVLKVARTKYTQFTRTTIIEIIKKPIISIQNSGWSFITKNTGSVSSKFNLKKKFKEVVNSTDIDGKVQLTTDGTSYFKSIKHDKIKRKEFFDNLRLELAKAIPVSSERITTSGRHQIDTTVSPEQYILSINIKKAKNKGERSVNSIAEDLNT